MESNSHLLYLWAEKAKAQALIMRAAEDRLSSWSHLSSWLGKTGTLIHGTGTFELMHAKFWILKFPETIQVCKSDYWHCPPAPILSKDEAESSFLHGLCAPLSICLPSWPGATTRVKSQPSGDVLCLRMAETEHRQSPAYHQTIFFFLTLQWCKSDTHSVETVLQNLNFDPSHP